MARLGSSERGAACPRRTERGASLPEYALAVAAIAVVLVAGINRLQSGATGELKARTSAGAPDLTVVPSVSLFSASTSTTAAPSPTSTTVPASANTALSASASAKGSKWTMTVTLTVTDPLGQPLLGATVTAAWNPGSNGTTACITAPPSGVCSVTQDQMKISDTPSATMTVVSISSPGGSVPNDGASITSSAP
jgi:Flp pilus assembly pilin Flp